MLNLKKEGLFTKKHLFGSPYSLMENFRWLKRRFLWPSTINYGNVEYLSKSTVLNEITPKYTLCLIGDIMDLNLKDLIIGEGVKSFVKGSDFLIGNFEATLTSEKRLVNSKYHKPQIMDALEDLFAPKKTYLSTANNHSGDFGEINFLASVNQLKKKGFNVFGTKSTPFLDLANDLRVIGSTQWSNRPCNYLTKLEDSSQFLKRNSFNLLFPHWGYEMELYPRRETIKQGMELLSKFNAIIGHHSHCPQPVSFFPLNNNNKLIAYSLGDFCDGKEVEIHNYGIAIKIEIGIDVYSQWQVGKCDWTFLKTHPLSNTEFIVDKIDNFSDFSFTYKSLGEEYRAAIPFSNNWLEKEQVAIYT